MNEIAPAKPIARAWNGQPIRNTINEVMNILQPMLALYPQTPLEPETLAVYIDMLRDIAPDKLAECVRLSMAESEWLPTVAHIRRHYEELRQVVPPRLKMEELPELNINGKLYRETVAERMERLKRIDRRERRRGN